VRRETRQAFIAVGWAALLAIQTAGRAPLDTVSSEITFTISRGQGGPFVKRLPIRAHGRIVLDVSSVPKGVELVLRLSRPDSSTAGDISGRGGNLSLTYFATEREVKDSLAAGNTQWSVSITRASGGEDVSGRLKIAHPG
jgi:hypothetical protein